MGFSASALSVAKFTTRGHSIFPFLLSVAFSGGIGKSGCYESRACVTRLSRLFELCLLLSHNIGAAESLCVKSFIS